MVRVTLHNYHFAFLAIGVVYHSADALEVVLNSLAIAFISALDDEYKASVFSSNETLVKYLVHTELQIIATDRDALRAQDGRRVKIMERMLIWPMLPMAGLCLYVPLCM